MPNSNFKLFLDWLINVELNITILNIACEEAVIVLINYFTN